MSEWVAKTVDLPGIDRARCRTGGPLRRPGPGHRAGGPPARTRPSVGDVDVGQAGPGLPGTRRGSARRQSVRPIPPIRLRALSRARPSGELRADTRGNLRPGHRTDQTDPSTRPAAPPHQAQRRIGARPGPRTVACTGKGTRIRTVAAVPADLDHAQGIRPVDPAGLARAAGNGRGTQHRAELAHAVETSTRRWRGRPSLDRPRTLARRQPLLLVEACDRQVQLLNQLYVFARDRLAELPAGAPRRARQESARRLQNHIDTALATSHAKDRS